MNRRFSGNAAQRCAFHGMRRFAVAALLLLPLLAASRPAQAVNVQSLFGELCQYYILDSDTCAAKAVLECLTKSGGNMGGMQQCAADYDPEAQKFIDIYGAATKPDYVRLLELAGPVIACKLLPPGPPANVLCSTALKPIVSKAFGKAAKIYAAAAKGDWLTVIYVVGDPTIACAVVPSFPGKDLTCGAVAQLLVEGGKLLKQGAQAGLDVLEGGAAALGNLASAGLESLGLGGAGVAGDSSYYTHSARPLLHRRALKAVMATGKPPFLGFDEAMLKQCASVASIRGLGTPPSDSDYKVCQARSQQLHNEAIALANLVRVAPAAYFENVGATASLLLATNFWSGKADQFVTVMGQLPRPKWSEEGLGSLPSPFSAVLGSCYASAKTAFPVPLGPKPASLEVAYPPNLWGWVCGSAGVRLAFAISSEKARLTKQVFPQLASLGCIFAKTGDSSMKFDCDNGKALAMCYALLPDAMPKSRCRKAASFKTSTVETLNIAPARMSRLPVMVAQPPAERAPLAVVSPPAVASPPVRAAPGAMALPTLLNLEAEDSFNRGQVTVTAGRVGVQPMQSFGSGWSGDAQLFWTGGSVGAALELAVEVRVAGQYAMELYFTRAPDYADVSASVNGQPMGDALSLYSTRVMAPNPVQAGRFALNAGPNTIRLEIAGKYAASTGYFVGIDRVRFYPTGR